MGLNPGGKGGQCVQSTGKHTHSLGPALDNRHALLPVTPPLIRRDSLQQRHTDTCPGLLCNEDPRSQTPQAPKNKLIMAMSHSLFLEKNQCEIPGQNSQRCSIGGFAKCENASVGKTLLIPGGGRSKKGPRPSQESTVSMVPSEEGQRWPLPASRVLFPGSIGETKPLR